MCKHLIVFRVLICVSLVSISLETQNFAPRSKTKFTVNSENNERFGDVILSAEVNTSSEAFHRNGMRFDNNINKVYVWINEEDCWYIRNTGEWKRKHHCYLGNSHRIKEMELNKNGLHNKYTPHKVIPSRGYRDGYN